MTDILLSHAAAYPLMEPSDAVKLIYQATFGGGHLITDETAVLARIRAEYSSCKHADIPLRIESLGGTSRIYLDSVSDDTELQIIAKIFSASAKYYSTGYSEASEQVRRLFSERLALLRKLCGDGHFAFTPSKLDDYLCAYRAAGYPPVSHSDTYRTAYSPAYRVIDSRYVRLIGVIKSIAAHLKKSAERTIIAIDGRCASGKSTAAKLISDIFDAQIIRMDDFFLPPELRTPERLNEVGGNIHRERFLDEVIPYLHDETGFSYRPFDCSIRKYSNTLRRIEPCELIICEGSYSLHPSFGRYYDLAVFSDISGDEQIRRIRERDGEQMLTRFKNEWIPMEEVYFESFDIKSKCDFII